MINFLKSIDQFGVAFQPNIKYSTSQYKTWLGGTMSILLYGASLAYFLYIFIQWQLGSLLPKITSSSTSQTNIQFQQQDQVMEIGLRKFYYTDIDPFNPNAMIIQPTYHIIKNGVWSNTTYIPTYETVKQDNGFHHLVISNLSLSLSDIKYDEFPETEIMILFAACQTSWLKNNQQCANQTTIDNFLQQLTNQIFIKQFTQEFNTQTQQIETVGREQVIPLSSIYSYSSFVYVQLQSTNVDTGFLFESMTEYSLINEYRLNGVTLDEKYYGSFLKIYLTFSYKLDTIQVIQSITYPKLSEVLADAASIASTLLLLSYFVITINQNQLRFTAINDVIAMYYPEFKNIQITKNIFGKIQKIQKNDKIIDLKIFTEKYEKWKSISEMKLSISNQLYEISRLQFLLQSMLPYQTLQNIHQMGIQLPEIFFDPGDQTDKIDISNLQQDFQEKKNKILPNEFIQKLPESRLILKPQNENGIQLKDSDFDLLALQINDQQ